MKYSEAFTIVRKPASEQDVSSLLSCIGSLPEAYLNFLCETGGADGAVSQPENIAVRLLSVTEMLDQNTGYRIQDSLPQLWMIGDDGGDYAYCFDRSVSSPDNWPVVEVPLGALFATELFTVADSFLDWQDRSFVVRHGFGDPALAFSEIWLVLDEVGPSPAEVAHIVQTAIRGTAPSSYGACSLAAAHDPSMLSMAEA